MLVESLSMIWPRPMTEQEQRAWDGTLVGADENRIRAFTRLKQEIVQALPPLTLDEAKARLIQASKVNVLALRKLIEDVHAFIQRRR